MQRENMDTTLPALKPWPGCLLKQSSNSCCFCRPMSCRLWVDQVKLPKNMLRNKLMSLEIRGCPSTGTSRTLNASCFVVICNELLPSGEPKRTTDGVPKSNLGFPQSLLFTFKPASLHPTAPPSEYLQVQLSVYVLPPKNKMGEIQKVISTKFIHSLCR